MFRVDWDKLALAHLTVEWTTADSQLRADSTAATNDTEKYLRGRADRAGESREPGTRVLIVHPLTVTFHVNVRTNTVLVSGARISHRKR